MVDSLLDEAIARLNARPDATPADLTLTQSHELICPTAEYADHFKPSDASEPTPEVLWLQPSLKEASLRLAQETKSG